MDGFQFLKKLRSDKRWVPVIMISALTESSNIFKGYELEADYYIAKPIDLENTLKAIQIMSSLIPLRKE
jgi:DNA-binding response OmpR family regulator